MDDPDKIASVVPNGIVVSPAFSNFCIINNKTHFCYKQVALASSVFEASSHRNL